MFSKTIEVSVLIAWNLGAALKNTKLCKTPNAYTSKASLRRQQTSIPFTSAIETVKSRLDEIHSSVSALTPTVPGIVTLIVNTLQFLHSTQQSTSQSNILAIVFPLMLLRSRMNSLMMCAVKHQLPPSGKSSKLTCLQKPIHGSWTNWSFACQIGPRQISTLKKLALSKSPPHINLALNKSALS